MCDVVKKLAFLLMSVMLKCVQLRAAQLIEFHGSGFPQVNECDRVIRKMCDPPAERKREIQSST